MNLIPTTTSSQLIAKLGSAQSAFHVINQNAAVAAISPQSSPSTPLLSPPTAAAADPVTQLLHQFRLQRPAAAAAAAPTSPSVSTLTSSSGRTVVAAVSPTPPPQTQQTKTPTSETKMYTPQAEFFGGETFNFKNDYMMHTVTVSSGMTSPQILESPQTPSTAAGGANFLCQICSDRATGKHYGASSCDGCKGFFRRTIRKQQEYKCRFVENCVIDKDKRNTCRFCRFQKCVNAGMMRNAVQSERDSISVKRKRSSSQHNRSSHLKHDEKLTTTITKTTNYNDNNNNTINNNNNNFNFAPSTPSSPMSPPAVPPPSVLSARRRVSIERQPSTPSTTTTTKIVVVDDPHSNSMTTSTIVDRKFGDDAGPRYSTSTAAAHSPQIYGADHVYCPPAVTPEDQLAALKQAENLFVRQQSTTSGACTPNISGPSTPASSSAAHSPSTCGAGAGGFLGGNAGGKTRLATVEDLADSIKEQLLLLVEWAKALPPFIELSLDDQVSLLRSYSAEHLLLGVARRSLPYKGVLLLSNDACIPRHHSSNIHDVNHVVFRILDELVEPMRELQLDDTEIGCLKALLFFNPNASGLVNKTKVKETRQQFLTAFHEYVTNRRSENDKVRFGSLLLLLPPLQAMSQQFVEDLQLASLFGIKTFDKLLEELLLATASSAFLADGINAVAKKFSDNQQVEQNGQLSTNNNNNMIDLTCLDHNAGYSIHHHMQR